MKMFQMYGFANAKDENQGLVETLGRIISWATILRSGRNIVGFIFMHFKLKIYEGPRWMKNNEWQGDTWQKRKKEYVFKIKPSELISTLRN